MLIYKNTKPKYAKHKILLKLNNQKLNQVQHKKYLGVVFDTHLIQHLQHVTKKYTNKINILKKISGVKWGLDSESALTYLKASIIPTLEYGIEIIPKNNFNFFKLVNALIAKSIKSLLIFLLKQITNSLLLKPTFPPPNIVCNAPPLCTLPKF